MKNQLKYLTLSLCCMFFIQNLQSQSLYFEDFSAGMPGDITLIDGDSLTINPALAPIFSSFASWIVKPDSGFASSTSWFTPEGCCADDWMILPAVAIGEHVGLRWTAMTPDSFFPDGYEVRISLNGNEMDSFFNEPVLYSIQAENTEWTERFVYLNLEGYQDTTVHIAFVNNSNDKFILRIGEIELFDIPDLDASVEGLIYPQTRCEKTAAESVTIEIKNNGIDEISGFELYYSVNGGALVTETFADTLQFNQTTTYTFNQTVDMSPAGVYEFTIGVNLPNDQNPGNDEMTGLTVETINPLDIASTELDMGFEPTDDFTGWDILDNNQSGATWNYSSFDPHTGDFSAVYFWDEMYDADDWLFTPCLSMEAENYYVLEFYYAIASPDFPERLKVHMGNAPEPGSMQTMIVDFGTLLNDNYRLSSNVFSPDSTGIYYIGFHAYSEADQWALMIDDVNVRLLEKPVADFNYSTDNFTVDFTDMSTNLPNQWDWDFGEPDINAESTEQNPSYTYQEAGTYEVCLVASNQAGSSDAVCKEITVEHTNVRELSSEQRFTVYPNPTKNTLHIMLNVEVTEKIEIVMFNQLGQKVKQIYSGDSANETQQTDISGLSTGVYFIHLKSESYNEVRKVVVTD